MAQSTLDLNNAFEDLGPLLGAQLTQMGGGSLWNHQGVPFSARENIEKGIPAISARNMMRWNGSVENLLKEGGHNAGWGPPSLFIVEVKSSGRLHLS